MGMRTESAPPNSRVRRHSAPPRKSDMRSPHPKYAVRGGMSPPVGGAMSPMSPPNSCSNMTPFVAGESEEDQEAWYMNSRLATARVMTSASFRERLEQIASKEA